MKSNTSAKHITSFLEVQDANRNILTSLLAMEFENELITEMLLIPALGHKGKLLFIIGFLI
jgi:hypothetical protein